MLGMEEGYGIRLEVRFQKLSLLVYRVRDVEIDLSQDLCAILFDGNHYENLWVKQQRRMRINSFRFVKRARRRLGANLLAPAELPIMLCGIVRVSSVASQVASMTRQPCADDFEIT